MQAVENEQGGNYNSNGLLENRETTRDNVGLAQEALSGKSVRGRNIGDSRGYQGTSIIEAEDTVFFLTSQGEVYGFVDKDGNIYLDETVITPEHPIHEYTHLWDRAVEKLNPKFWKTGVNIFKKTFLWNEILNDENYGKRWQATEGMTPERLESLIASEVHARLTGERGKELLEQIAKDKGSKGIIGKLKQWLLDFWKTITGAFTPWTDDQLKRLNDLAEKDLDKALKYLSDMTLKDFTEGVNPMTQQPVQQNITKDNAALTQFKKDVNLLAGYYEGGGRHLRDDLPAITDELNTKLANHFMGGEELSTEDYRKLWKLLEFYNTENGERAFRPKRQATQPKQQVQENVINPDNNRSNIEQQLQSLRQQLQLEQYESNSKGNATTTGQSRQTADGGLLDAAQTRVQRRDGNVRKAQEQGALSQKDIDRRNQQDTETIEKFAKEQNCWIDEDTSDYLSDKYGKLIGKGAESFVYRKDNNTVIKTRTIDPSVDGSYSTIQEALDSIAIHNKLFPETAMKVVSFGYDGGELNILVEQPYIEGRFATTEEVEKFIKDKYRDAEKDENISGGNSYKTAAYLLQDLKPQNVIIKEANGQKQLFVIDGDFYFTEKHKEYLHFQNFQQSPTPVSSILSNPDSQSSFTPHPVQMTNLAQVTGERLIQTDKAWKEKSLQYLDRDLGQAIEQGNETWKQSILNQIEEVKHAVDRISLPNYEHMNDLSEPIMVDAEWKIVC